MRARQWLVAIGVPVLILALLLGGDSARSALAQSWPPFLLVGGLLLIGILVGHEGLFDYAASRLVALPVGPLVLLGACYGTVALTTALLNLDTAAVFLTPVLIRVAQRRGLDLSPFLYGCVFMANASSLFLPGSNLTNLLVLSSTHVSGGTFLLRMLAISLTATATTAVGLLFMHRSSLRHQGLLERSSAPARFGLGFWGAGVAAGLMLLLAEPAVPVFALGLALVSWRIIQGRMTVGEVYDRLGPAVLLALFAAAVCLGTIARATGFPGNVLRAASQPKTAIVAALASVLVNNLPAAALLSSRPLAHPQALLLGLAVGPNLALTGALSALLWWRASLATEVRPSALEYSRQGVPLALLAITCALVANAVVGASLR